MVGMSMSGTPAPGQSTPARRMIWLTQVLCAQAIVGRWRPAGPETPSGVRRPTTTPTEAMTIKSLAVVVGEFGPSSGMKSLKEAIEEGQQLTASYPSVWVKATASEVATLLKGQLTDRGVPVDAMRVARAPIATTVAPTAETATPQRASPSSASQRCWKRRPAAFRNRWRSS